MSAHTTFKIGGPADLFIRPEGVENAARLYAEALREGIPLFVLGGGANLLVGDRGIRGIVLDTGSLCQTAVETWDSETATLSAGAGLGIDELCLDSLALGLGGLEDFYGLPGTVGGAAYMNARCYESEMAEVLAWVDSCDKEGCIHRRHVHGATDSWSYKRSPYQPGGLAAGELILAAGFRLARLDDGAIAAAAAVMRNRRADREHKGHFRLPSAGSVFKNDHSLGRPSGKILDELGMRGRRIGDALISDWHANIFVNAGAARARDMKALVQLAQDEAQARLGAKLEAEIVFVGDFS